MSLTDNLDFESFYIVKRGDNLWKIAKQYEVTNQGIQKFIDYLIRLNPLLTEQKRKVPGDFIKPGDVILLNSPDYTYQNFLNGCFLSPSVVCDFRRRNEIRRDVGHNVSESFQYEVFLTWLGYVNNGLGSVDFKSLFKNSLAIREAIRNLEIYVSECMRLANQGLLDEKIFREEFSRRMKKISEMGGKKIVDLYQAYKKAMKGPKSIIGNRAAKTYGKNKNIIKFPRLGRKRIDLGHSRNIVQNHFKWQRHGAKAYMAITLGLDMKLRVDSINKAHNKSRERVMQYCGFTASLFAATYTGALCATLVAGSGGLGIAGCTFLLSMGTVYAADKMSTKICEWSYDTFVGD